MIRMAMMAVIVGMIQIADAIQIGVGAFIGGMIQITVMIQLNDADQGQEISRPAMSSRSGL